MKKYVREFLRRGLVASGLGPIVLALLYLFLHHKVGIETLTVSQVCTGIISLYILAFIAGGMNVVYQIDRIPLMLAILIHGGVLYISYLATYLVNGWLQFGKAHVLAFTVIFFIAYLIIWAFIYSVTKKNTTELNKMLQKKQQNTDNKSY